MYRILDAPRFSDRLFLLELGARAAVLTLVLSYSPSTARASEPDGAPKHATAESEAGSPAQPGSVQPLDLSDVQESPDGAKSRGPEVVATGVGSDPQSAEQNALANAVEQVVGMLVDAETLVTNDQIVRDQVLTYSRGFVEDHKEIARWQKDGLHYVRIRALVSATRLGEKLKAQKVVLREIEGDKIAIRIKFEEFNEEQAKQMFRKAVADFTPDTMLTVTLADGKPAVERGPNGVKLTVSYRLTANLEAWRSVHDNLMPLMDRLSTRKRNGAFLEGQGFVFSGAQAAGDSLAVFRSVSRDGVATDWVGYGMPKWLRPELAALEYRFHDYRRGYIVTVALLDEQSRVIAKVDRPFSMLGWTAGVNEVGRCLVHDWSTWYDGGLVSYWIGPLLGNGANFRQVVDLSETFSLDTDQVAKVTKCAVSIVNRAQ